MRAMLERTLTKRIEARFWKFFWLNIIGVMLFLIGGCTADEAEVDESALCYERYIEEFSEQYPLETLQKTAALKCYS